MNTSHNEIKLIECLSKLTSYRDKNLLEQCLTNTIGQIFPGSRQRLFNVKTQNDVTEITLVASVGYNEVENPHQKVERKFIRLINSLLDKVISTNKIQDCEDPDSRYLYTVYPIYDDNHNVISLLLSGFDIQQVNYSQHESNHSLCIRLLEVYNNYLTVLTKTQRDKLTGLFNRETLDERIMHVLKTNVSEGYDVEPPTMSTSENRRIKPHKKTYLGMVDIDHFKAINDNYGHLYGDEILVLVSRCMVESFTRINDLVYRYGGEEFVVLLKAYDTDDAFQAFERLRKNIERYDFPQVRKVTVSIGFELIDNQSSPQEIIAAADSALYYVKSNNRNATSNYQRLIEGKKIAPSKPVQSEDAILF